MSARARLKKANGISWVFSVTNVKGKSDVKQDDHLARPAPFRPV